MGKRKHRRKRFEKVEKKPFAYYLKKLLFWFVTYFVFISLLTILLEGTQIYQNKIGFYIIMGYLLVLLSRIVYSATRRKSLRLEGVLIWGLIYTVVFGVLNHLLSLLPQIQINVSYDKYISIAVFSAIFTIVLMFLRRMHIRKMKIGRFKAPSQILTGILLIVVGILVLRFSHIIFLEWFGWAEGMAWSWLIGLGFLIAGVLTLIAWWRNNVLQHRIGIKFGKWK